MASKFSYNFTPENNGGESLTFNSEYEYNGDEFVQVYEQLTLNSYASGVNITTYGVFTSENMFKFAKALLEFELTQKIQSNL
jgi:hypothetical protein